MRGLTRLGMPSYGAAAGAIDLGDEPPLTLRDDKDDLKAPLPRAVSWRWMTGTVLTGVTSIFLMGAALIAALSNPDQFASLPDSFAATASSVEGIVFGRKADRIHPVEERVSNRQILQVSTVTRQGERDFIKLKPFVKINATLGLGTPEIAAKVPAFDPMHIFADTSAPDDSDADTDADASDAAVPVATTATPPDDQLYGAAVDGEVSVKVTDFPIANPDLDPNAVLNTPEVEQIVRAAANIDVPGDADTADTLAYDDANTVAGSTGSPAPAPGVKIVPENVSNVAKSDATGTLDDGYQEKIIPVAKAESLRTLFQDNNITGDDADEIIAALSQLVDVSRLRPDQKIRIGYAVDPSANPATDASAAAAPGTAPAPATPPVLRPIRVSIYADDVHQATVARSDNNVFVRADEPGPMPAVVADTPPPQAPPTADDQTPTLYDAVYQTALEQQVPPALIDDLIKAFAYDVDFQAHIGVGDSMEIFHSLPDPNDQEASDPQILFASLTLGGVTKRLYRFVTADDGVADYYDEDGHSAKKFLLRKPMTMGRITSPFGWRVHPLLGYRRLHAGVDYGAPKGTAILAAGNGVVERAGPSSGYGNLIEIKHTNGYETLYGHQSAFADGIKVGLHVHQGQLIGYVGSTGLSTGPHLHFEIRVNGTPVDPLRIRLPRGRVLEGDYLTAFEHERDRIDALLGTQPAPAQKVASADDLTE